MVFERCSTPILVGCPFPPSQKKGLHTYYTVHQQKYYGRLPRTNQLFI